MSMFTRTGLQ